MAPPGTWVQKASDDFIRTNENPLSGGGNWSSQGRYCKLIGNTVYGVANGYQNVSVWTARTWLPDQYATVYCPLYDGGNLQGPALRCTGGANDGYYFRFRRGPGANSSTVDKLYKTSLDLSGSISYSFTQANVNSLVAGNVTVYIKGWDFTAVDEVTGLVFCTATDTGHRYATGSPGVMVYTSNSGPPGVLGPWYAGEDASRVRYPLVSFKG